jgi:hypothetical protein
MRQALLLAAWIVVTGCGDGPSQSSGNVREWYEGGTLHKATARQWFDATPANRLATSADFVSGILKPRSMAEMKAQAEEMQTCISEAAPTSPSQSVAQLGAACAIVLGWKE